MKTRPCCPTGKFVIQVQNKIEDTGKTARQQRYQWQIKKNTKIFTHNKSEAEILESISKKAIFVFKYIVQKLIINTMGESIKCDWRL